MSLQYTIDCFANISSREACTITQKLDLDQMSERSIHTLKDTNVKKEKKSPSAADLGLFASYNPVWICHIKCRTKCPRNFRPPPLILLTQTNKRQRTHLGNSVYKKRRRENFNSLFYAVSWLTRKAGHEHMQPNSEIV